jgi:signal transduction histidine kinase
MGSEPLRPERLREVELWIAWVRSARPGRSAAGLGANPGSGLGLFIARSIAEAHGGSLEVDSGPDRGSRLTLELPSQRS